MNFIIFDIFASIIGWIYLYLRYGRRAKEVLKEEYMDQYSLAGKTVMWQAFAIVLLLLIGGLLIAAAIFYSKKLF